MKLPPALEATLLEPHVVAHCPSTCCFNRTCPERVQSAMEKLWIDGTITASNYRTTCYRFQYLAQDVAKVAGLVEPFPDADAEWLYELLTERMAFSEPDPPTPKEVQATDPWALEMREKVMKLRDTDRHRREEKAKAEYDATHPQTELGV
jgi:hypothetical protein